MAVHFHYTSVDTLLKIVENRKWRFTNVNYMNDGNEFHFGWNLIQTIEPRLAQIDPNETVVPFWVTCFSKDADSFSQWAMYGDSGSGVAIGIDTEIFGNGIVRLGRKDSGPHPFTSNEVIYDETLQEELICSTLEQNREQLDREDFITNLPLEVLQLPIRFKQRNFDSEKEVRCVQHFPVHQPETMDDENLESWRSFARNYLKYTWRNQKLIPFLEIPITPPNVIKRIVTGPRFLQGNNLKMLKYFLQLHELGSVEISSSTIVAGV
jgi:hypothetical protein